jgi:hypothetical protein
VFWRCSGGVRGCSGLFRAVPAFWVFVHAHIFPNKRQTKRLETFKIYSKVETSEVALNLTCVDML